MIEGYCGENEKDLSHFTGKRSDGAVKVPVGTLARYAGVFSEVLPNGRSRRVVFSLFDGELWAAVDGNARMRHIAFAMADCATVPSSCCAVFMWSPSVRILRNFRSDVEVYIRCPHSLGGDIRVV